MGLGFSDTCGDSHRNEEVRSTFEFPPGGVVRSKKLAYQAADGLTDVYGDSRKA